MKEAVLFMQKNTNNMYKKNYLLNRKGEKSTFGLLYALMTVD